MLLTQGVILAMPGILGIYFHSLICSSNYHEGVKLSGLNRSINREKLNYDHLVEVLCEEGTVQRALFLAYRRLISIRIHKKAFNPFGKFEFLNISKKIFAILQKSLDESENILALHNFSYDIICFMLPEVFIKDLQDLLSDASVKPSETITMQPYQIMWLKF